MGYIISPNIKDLTILEKYGFKKGNEYPDYERCICNESDYEDYWLISMSEDDKNEVLYANEDYDQPIWSVHITNFMDKNHVCMDFTPSCTYHISSSDLAEWFDILYDLIKDNIIVKEDR